MGHREYAKLKQMAAELRDEFKTLADDLDWHLKNVNIARISGGVAGVVGGIVAAVGIIAIPFTAGLSAVVAGIGGSIAAGAGGVTAAGAKIAHVFIEGSKCKEAAEKWNTFCRRARALMDDHGELTVSSPGLKEFLQMSVTAIGIAEGVQVAALRGATVVVGRAAGQIGVATVAGGVMSVLVVGLSLRDIVDGAIEIHRKKQSKAGDIFRKLADRLDKIADE